MITMIFRVVEGDRGRPVADAEVRVPYPEPEREYRTDAEGICEIEIPELEEERLTVLGRKEGFVPMRVLWEISRTGSKLPGDYTLRLERGTRIGGTIRDDLGVPIEGATVFLWIWMPKEVDGAQLNPDILNTTVVTDAHGRWSFEEGPAELPDVGYRLEHRDFVEELYSRKAEESAGLRDGTAIWVMQRGVRVEGVVVDEDGRPIENAQILPGKDRMCSRSDGLIRTDVSGKFSIPLKPGPESLTIKAEGFAPALMQVDAGEVASPLRIALERGRVVRGCVVDDAGNALPRTHVFADTWRRHRTLAWLGVTDAAGKFLWDSAPPDEVLFDILCSGYRGRRRVPLVASNDEHRVVLLKPFRVGGTVRDAATGKAIELFRVIPGYTQQNGPINWLRKNAAEFTGGNYEREFKGDIIGDRVLFLRIEAEGYLSGVARIEDSGRPTTIDFQLQPGPAAGGCLLKPDGTTAGDTTVAVVSGNPALLQGEKLDAGHGNMEVKTAADGTFWFPPQEPPYAIVAVHQEGCLFAMAEDLARDPILRLKAWGSLEIISDGGGADDSPVPFYMRYPLQEFRQAPGSPRRLPWLNIQPVGKRIARNRILFQNLMPGAVFVGRIGTPGPESIDVLIKEGKTTALDFDRGLDGSEEQVPGSCVVKVIDEAGVPVQGAMATALAFSLKAPPGSSATRMISQEPPRERLTNSHGVAVIRYPATPNREEIKSVKLRVRHPDFCTAFAQVPVTGEALPVVMARGGIVRIVGFIEDGGAPGRIYGQIVSDDKAMTDPDTWVHEEPGGLRNTRVPPGDHTLRIACFPEECGARFSDAVHLDVAAGQLVELRLPVARGWRFEGKLDGTVPRPVLNGHVEVNVVTRAEGVEHPLDWRARTDVEADGSFVFESLPRGLVELIAFCDGFISKSLEEGEARIVRKPQTFEPGRGSGAAVVAMERAATIHVRVTDGEGRPVPGARAHLNPNVIWGGRYSEIFGTGRATEEFLRMAAEERQKHFAGRGWAPKFFALTDEKGIATIRNIPVGKQHLIVFGKGAETQPWPSGARRLDRNEIELSAGEAREVRVMLREASGGRE